MCALCEWVSVCNVLYVCLSLCVCLCMCVAMCLCERWYDRNRRWHILSYYSSRRVTVYFCSFLPYEEGSDDSQVSTVFFLLSSVCFLCCWPKVRWWWWYWWCGGCVLYSVKPWYTCDTIFSHSLFFVLPLSVSLLCWRAKITMGRYLSHQVLFDTPCFQSQFC